MNFKQFIRMLFLITYSKLLQTLLNNYILDVLPLKENTNFQVGIKYCTDKYLMR